VAPGRSRSLRRQPRKFYEGVAQELIGYARASVAPRRVSDPLPKPPKLLGYLWVWFCELSSARTSNGYGLNPITFPEIDAWTCLMGVRPTPWETSVLRRMDAATLSVLNNKQSAGKDISAKDTAGVKSLFAGLKARAAEVFG
jgi:hypothetical protein